MDSQREEQIRAEIEAKLQREAAIRAEVEAKLAKELKAKEWKELNAKANEGDANAQFKVACSYFDGCDVEQNYALAIEWYTKAAELGLAAASKKLYECYINGKGTEKDANAAIKWLTMAADAGDAESQSDLANRYANGTDVEKDLNKAFHYYELAANQDVWIAICNLGGWCYLYGNGVEKSPEQAVLWLEKALKKYGMNDSQSVYEWTKNAYSNALSDYGLEIENNNSDDESKKKALECYQKSADFGNTFGMSNLGHCYHKGIGTEVDLAKADELYSKAKSLGHSNTVFDSWITDLEDAVQKKAESGDAFYQGLLGYWYSTGGHGEKNNEKALRWLTEGVSQNDSMSQYYLGDFYVQMKDYDKAFYWFKKSANSNAKSMAALGGICYLEGQGCKKDIVMAQYWLSRAYYDENQCDEITHSNSDKANREGSGFRLSETLENAKETVLHAPVTNKSLFDNSLDIVRREM